MNHAIRRIALCVPVAALLALMGCGGSKDVVEVTGRITENDATLKTPEGLPPGTRSVVVAFYPLSDENDLGDPQYAVVEDNGTFSVPGPKGKGIDKGKYRVVVEAAKGGTGGGAAPKPPPMTGGRPPGVGPGAGGGPGASAGGLMGFEDRFRGAFSKDRSPLIVEISETCEVLVDVGGRGKVSVK